MRGSIGRGYQEGSHARKARRALTLAAGALLTVALVSGLLWFSSGWTTVGTDQLDAISGLARIGTGPGGDLQLLAVHDNKLPAQARLTRLTIGQTLSHDPVSWPEGYALPVDLEAISPIPGSPDLFLTLTSGGTATLLQQIGDRTEVRGAFTVPQRSGLPNYEALSVQQLDDTLVAAWGDRGAGEQAGRLFWGRLDLEAPAVSDVQSLPLRVPYPMELNPNTRHISDLRIARDGRVWIAAANDPGDAGPFQSAVYRAGRFRVVDGAIHLQLDATLEPLRTYSRKIEALELTGDESALVLGTDDEWAGGAVGRLPLR